MAKGKVSVMDDGEPRGTTGKAALATWSPGSAVHMLLPFCLVLRLQVSVQIVSQRYTGFP